MEMPGGSRLKPDEGLVVSTERRPLSSTERATPEIPIPDPDPDPRCA